MRTEAQILADLNACDQAIIASRNLIEVHERALEENEALYAKLQDEMNEFDYQAALGASRMQALHIEMYGRPEVTGRRRTHTMHEALDVWVRHYGTQTAAAAAHGMTKTYFSRLMRGDKTNPSDATLDKLWLMRTGYRGRYKFKYEGE